MPTRLGTHLSARSRVNEGSLLLLEYIRTWSREAGEEYTLVDQIWAANPKGFQIRV